MKNKFQITFNYQLDPELKKLLGTKMFIISSPSGIYSITNPITFSCQYSLQLVAYSEYPNNVYSVVVFGANWEEIIGGDLYALEVKELLHLDRLGYQEEEMAATILGEFGIIIKIAGLGIVQTELRDFDNDLDDDSADQELDNGPIVTIPVDIRTLDAIAILFDNGKWLYIFADGDDKFRLELDVSLAPEDLWTRDDFMAAGKKIQVLDSFDFNDPQ